MIEEHSQPPTGTVLEAQGVSHAFRPGVPVLEDIDLAVNSGDRIALIGPSGSGKTTLLSILGLLLKPSQGTVTTPLNPTAAPAALRRDYFGWVFQTTNALSRRSVLDNVMVPLLTRDTHLQEAKTIATNALRRVGLDGLEDQPAYQLSGGELQRMCIARAVAPLPPLVLADEPTGQLDKDTSETVTGVLVHDLPADTALVVVTHDETIAAACHTIYALENGRILPRAGGRQRS